MSAGVVTFQAQVETVLGALFKAATTELTQLFESRYGALAVDAGRTKDLRGKETLHTPESLSSGESRRSIGVQVEEEDIYQPSELSAPIYPSEGYGCLRGCEKVEGCVFPSEILLDKAHGHTDPEWLPPKEQVVTQTVDMVELSVLEEESPADSDSQTEVVLNVSAQKRTETLSCESALSSPAKPKPLVIQPDTSATTSGDKVKFVCPLILKQESPVPKPKNSKKPDQASTAKGTAYSPSILDGAVTPSQVGVWERIHTVEETKNHLQMKLKLTPSDQKLLRPCAVQLVDMLMIPELEMKIQHDAPKPHSAHCKTVWPVPKDLRHHRGLHTGHRLCCFTQCGNGVWRLQKVVTRSHEGYACSICRKTFKRRKILRRHERFHTGLKPYSCSVCSKTFALRKSLRRHLRFHTGERPHTCTKCNKSFRLRENLKAHLRFHTGEKPFSCATCGKTFRILRNLEKHKLSHFEFFVPSFRTIAGM
ncbi:zinc finger protein 263 [Mugil cephalus]|uniref:zinc finger protein 263 n=1 Tax=Mugil cephalus TaxID=48193 RepID=UPI001FB7C673|nr:zinc finger protein 263 [Mugil cephalus]